MEIGTIKLAGRKINCIETNCIELNVRGESIYC